MSDPVNDEDRLAAPRTYRVPDQPRPPVLDELTRLAATMFDAREQAIPGVGLGRTMARAAVAVHRSDLAVTRGPHGTTARVTLPGLY